MNHEENPIESSSADLLKLEPPGELERRVVNALKSENLIRDNRAVRAGWKQVLAAVIAVFVFAGGFAAGRHSGSRTAAPVPRHPLFALLLYEPAGGFAANSSHVQEYVRWVRSVRSSGRIANGEKLKDEGRRLQMQNGAVSVSAGPLRNKDLLMGGYFLIEAENYEEAVRIASKCPHLKYGGIIEVRQIDAT